ncbi:ccaat/enhancer binding protein [Holotrichia oblita]|uniref:Ccaat/enhancer binding protein n=1 Tax=Holotrichia oblita TaxID=644536 RepID=A0ACB9TL34_HOLOL|nr:ccaat/enhancer binding protein [Holotrichia oblita]
MTVSDMAPKRGKPRKEMDSEEDGDEYRCKASRQKSKIKTAETMHRVNTLKSENTILQEKVKTLTKELGFLKELFLAHAGNSDKSKFEDVDLQQLLGKTHHPVTQ